MERLEAGDPEQVGPYRVVARLGNGGMGRVFLGRSPGGRLLAVKVIRENLAEDADFRTRFGREVAAARSVSGLFTAPVVDADLNARLPWLATAYVAGPSLADAVSRHGPLPPRSLLALMAGLAEGLVAIHEARVVHRDLKPANVLLAEDGPRVIDFGISLAAETSSLTHTGLVIGSPSFMSPEQAEGGPVGPPSDVFSLGSVLAYAATGEGPFGQGSTAAVVYRVVHAQPSLDRVPPEVRRLLVRCMVKDPVSRPELTQLLAELGEQLGGVGLVEGWLPAQIMADYRERAAALTHALPGTGHTPPSMPTARIPAPAPPARPASAPPAALPARVPPPRVPVAKVPPVPSARVPSARVPSARVPVTAAGPKPGPAPGPRPGDDRRRQRRAILAMGGAAFVIAAASEAVVMTRTGDTTRIQGRRLAEAASVPRVSYYPTATATAAASASPPASRTSAKAAMATQARTSGMPHSGASSAPSMAAVQPAGAPPATPVNVRAAAYGQYKMTVSWVGSSTGSTGFHVDNGCPVGACGGGLSLAQTTGSVTSAVFAVTPGTYQCFRVQALNAYGASGWSAYGCASTPGLAVSGTQQWTGTGVEVQAGDKLGMTASGVVNIAGDYGTFAAGPGGNQSCTPARAHPSDMFPAPYLPCFSLIARIGNGAPFEVGTSTLVVPGYGELYLGINDDDVSGNSGAWTVNIKLGALPPLP